MSIEINIPLIHASFAAVINEIQPNANIYDNPNQQGTVYPAWFIIHRSPVELRRDLGKIRYGNRYEITYSIDLWYLLEQNQTCMFDKYREIGMKLDDKLEYLKLFGTNIVVHVYDRNWSVEPTKLSYSTTLRLRVYDDVKSSDIPPTVTELEDIKERLKGQ